MSDWLPLENALPERRRFSYGWVIVGACTVMIAVTYGLMYSYGVFFKPLEEYFKWDRATLSAVYSISFIVRGIVSVGVGWLADKYGATRIMAVCGFMLGLGLALSSQVKELWQFYITYGFIMAVGLSGTFGIGTAMVARWFTKNRGLALGIVSTGSGLGTLLIVPGTERLIDAVDWSQTFLICGIAAGVVMIGSSFLLRPAPQPLKSPDSAPAGPNASGLSSAAAGEVPIKQVLKDPRMILFMAALMLFFLSIQIVMVHLVSYATDAQISPMLAATFISVIGAVSIAGRLITGVGADRAGIFNTLIFTRIFLAASFVFLIFAKPVWSFYLFAVIFGFPYGGEIPQVPLFVGKYWGTKSMATLVGLNTFVITVGGAAGSWGAGKIYVAAQSYRWAFIAGGMSSLVSLALILILRQKCRNTPEAA
ncbi:MAG: MFS transporter [Dehalococcoidales bacterium]|jgi:MFS family permease